MGSSGQLYSLSWGEFGSSLTSAVQLLRGHGDLVDVTLTAGGRSFPAHKIVLCAASPFLLDILKETPCKHPVVMLAGISPDDLESILEFVYHGQVSVEPSQLPSLLQAAHCLSIHGLSPPTIITEEGEQVPVEALPETSIVETVIETIDEVNQVNNNSCLTKTNKRKKLRKSQSLSNKWKRVNNCTNDDEVDDEQIDDEQLEEDKDKSIEIEEDDDDDDDDNETSQRLVETNWQTNQSSSHENGQQEQIIDLKQHLHNLLPYQQYSPLHIPSFPGSLSVGLPPAATTTTALLSSSSSSTSSLTFPLVQGASTSSLGTTTTTAAATTTTTTTTTIMTAAAAAAAAAAASKIRGASDCPGQCTFCGATLRQARNLRRHILSSCKYRFNTHATSQHLTDQMIVEIKPEIDMTGYMGQSYMTDSGGSNSCEPIVFKSTTPLSSPNGSANDINSPHRNGTSPTVAR